jgi:phage minor structural protein
MATTMPDYPKVYDGNGNLVAILHQAFNVVITDQLITDTNGQETLAFSVPLDDPKAQYITNETEVKCGGRTFKVRVVTQGYDSSSGIPSVDVQCEALWYDLATFDPVNNLQYSDVGPSVPMQAILQGTGWSVGTVEITTPQDFVINQPTNPLAAIRQIPQFYGGQLMFDTENKLVNLLAQAGTDNGYLVAYGKNMPANQNIVDTRTLVTRLYPYGANGLDITSVNPNKDSNGNGLPYLEDYSYYDNNGLPRVVKSATITNDQISNPTYLMLWAQKQLATLSQPQITHNISVSVDPTEGVPALGEIVTVYDTLLNVKLKAQVAQRTYYPLEPWNSTMQLNTAWLTLADQMSSNFGTGPGIASVADAVDQAMQDVTMFNNLFNSRADDGFAYWTHVGTGWSIDNTVGASGGASFKCVGQPGVTQTLTQTIYPATRSAYTISAQVQLDNIQKGANGKIGFQITIHYTDGTTETVPFIALA